MLDEAAKLASELRFIGDPGLRVRIGINTGPVILGNVGNLESGTYSAMGDTLNTAAPGFNRRAPASVAVTDNTYRLVSGVFEGQDLGEIKVKGKAEPVHCYRITGPRTVNPLVDSVGVLNSPIIGRDSQLAHLRQLIFAVRRVDPWQMRRAHAGAFVP